MPLLPRRPWMRNGVIALAIVLALLVVRLWWGYVADRRLAAAVAEIRARGEPMLVEDLARPQLAEHENAAWYLQKAMDNLNQVAESPASSNLGYRSYPPFPAEWHRLAAAAVEGNQASLAWARRSRPFPNADWSIPIDDPWKANYLGSLNRARTLANLLGDAAMHAQLQGDDTEALERIADVLHLARALDQQPWLVSYLVAVGIDALALSRLSVIVPGLSFDPPTGAQRQQLEGLIRQLLEPGARRESERNAMMMERMGGAAMIRSATEDAWLLRPMFQLDALRALQRMEYFVRATDVPSLLAARALLQQMPATDPIIQPAMAWGGNSRGQPVRYTRLYSSMMTVSLDRVIESSWRVELLRRLAAVSLAAQLYRLDHGDWPQSLEQLVPQYLPAVPLDPYTVDQPLRYRLIESGLPDGSPRPVVYSIGENGIDDTAAGQIPAQPRYEWDQRDADQLIDLARWTAHTHAEAERRAEQAQRRWYGEDWISDDEFGEFEAEIEMNYNLPQTVHDEPEVPDDPGEDPEP